MSSRLEEAAEQLTPLLGTITSEWIYELTRPGVRAYARAMGYTERAYYWLEDALALGYPDLPAPFGYLGAPIYLPGAVDERFSEPGDPAGVDLAGLRVLDAGTVHRVHRTPCAGETLSMCSLLTAVEPVLTALGPGLRVERALRFADAAGADVITQRRVTVYR